MSVLFERSQDKGVRMVELVYEVFYLARSVYQFKWDRRHGRECVRGYQGEEISLNAHGLVSYPSGAGGRF